MFPVQLPQSEKIKHFHFASINGLININLIISSITPHEEKATNALVVRQAGRHKENFSLMSFAPKIEKEYY